jgi:hypothetical protein
MLQLVVVDLLRLLGDESLVALQEDLLLSFVTLGQLLGHVVFHSALDLLKLFGGLLSIVSELIIQNCFVFFNADHLGKPGL